MATQQMDMNAAMPAPGMGPDQMAIFDRMRQEISPQEFSNEMLAGAAQIDPQAVATFTKELEGLDIPPEALDALNDVVDEILASPDKYAELRKKYMDQGLPEEILPEQYDPRFFAALNLAIDQMIAAPTGVQAFAKGGIAELKPIAKVIASYGRNGDTMLAHITPAEARMLRRRGGSGTTNPDTGLPEFFFLKKLFQAAFAPFKLVGKAVQSFAKSSIGRIVLPIALAFFLGPAAAGLLSVTSVAGVAAVSGFVGSSLSTLAAGGNLGQALKAGAIGGLTVGATAGVFGGADAFASNSAGTAGMTPGQAISKQFETFKGYLPDALTGGTTSAAPGLSPTSAAPVPPAAGVGAGSSPVFAGNVAGVPPLNALDVNYANSFGDATKGVATPGLGPTGAAPVPPLNAVDVNYANSFGDATKVVAAPYKAPTIGEAVSTIGKGLGLGNEPASFNTFKQGASDLFFPGGPSPEQIDARAAEMMSKNSKLPFDTAVKRATAELAPGILRTYGPAAVAGLGAMSAFGGFKTQPAQTGPITQSLMTPVTQRIRQDGTQSQVYLQGLPGVQYDQYGEPIAGYKQLPTYDVPDYNAGGYGMYSGSGQGIMNLPTVYNTPFGSIGSSRVEQPYNTASMYSNIMPRRYADGGPINSDNPISPNDSAPEPVAFDSKAYLKANPDLIRAGITEADAKAHWSNAGFKEGRPMNPAEAVAKQQAQTSADAENLAARTKVAQERAMRKAQGSGQMYANINAGLAALAPETFPGAPVTVSPERRAAIDAALKGTVTDIQKSRVMRDNAFRPEEIAAYANLGFGEVNRRYNTALRQDAYAPMLEEQRNAMNQQRDIAYNVPPASVKGGADEIIHFGIDQYGRDARNGFGTAPPVGINPYFNPTAPVTFPPVAPPVAPPTVPPVIKPVAPPTVPPVIKPVVPPVVPPVIPPATDAQKSQFTSMINSGDYQGGVNYARGLGYTDADIADYVGATGTKDVAGNAISQQTATNFLSGYPRLLNMGGIAALGMGGYPRRTGQISGPGTEKSDDIPAMLSDGEFVMTASAVRGAGKGSRRAGAKKMYKLMHQLERNAERG